MNESAGLLPENGLIGSESSVAGTRRQYDIEGLES